MADKSFWSDKKDKEWLKNFWYYYRFRIICGIVILAFSLFGIRQCVTRITPDLSITVAMGSPVSDDVSENMKKAFSEIIDDVDGEYGKVISISVLDLPSGNNTSEFEASSLQQLLLEMTAGESYLYIMDRERFVASRDSGTFEDISDITGDEEPTFYIDVTDNGLLKSLGFQPETAVCAGIRSIPGARKDIEYEEKKHDNARKVLREIIEGM